MTLDCSSPRLLGHCVDHMKDMLIWIGSDGRMLHANASALAFYGLSLEALRQLTIHDLDPHFRRSSWPQHWEALKRIRNLTVIVQHRDSEGNFQAVEVVDNYQCVDGHEFSVAVVRRVDHRDDRSQRMQLMEFSVDQMTDFAIWIGPDARILFANDSTCRNLGYSHDELKSMTMLDIDARLDAPSWARDWERLILERTRKSETEYRRKDGRLVPVEVTSNLLRSFDREFNCAFVRDVTERRRHEAELNRLATHDVLTGLPSRALLNDRIEQAIAHAIRDGSHVGVMMIDLDKFKLINDNMGHDVGDALLQEVAARVATVLRNTDTVLRLGGDEFVVVLQSLSHAEDCAMVGEKLMQVIGMPLRVGELSMTIGASVGIAVYPIDGTHASALLKNADIAMYQAKSRGRGNYQFYTREMGERVSQHLSIVHGLQKALVLERFVLHFQPIYDIGSRRLVGAEALLRWLDPARGLIPPNEFVPVAEESGLISAIGNWVVQEACRQIGEWRRAGLRVVPVSVNLSASQLNSAEIVDVVGSALSRFELPPQFIRLELTESMMMNDPEQVIAILKDLRSMGVLIAIDDFGTGYSSLSYLQKFPIDVIKIDRSFVSGIDEGDAVIVNAIIRLAHTLGCKVLAEGVESALQCDYLRRQGCDLVQGFFYGRPVAAAAFANILELGSPAPCDAGQDDAGALVGAPAAAPLTGTGRL